MKAESNIKIRDFKYCILRCNQRVKKVVEMQMKKKMLTFKALSELSGVHHYKISEYLKKAYATYDGSSYPSQKEVIAICAALGVEVTIAPKIVAI